MSHKSTFGSHLLVLLCLLLSLLSPTATAKKKTVSYSDVPARLHWIGKTPTAAKPVSFGIPFDKGEMKPTGTFTLTTDDGQQLAADFWPTAYWPDGSVKWGGFAAVVPGGTKGVSLSLSPSPSPTPSSLQVQETTSQFHISSGDFSAYIPKGKGTAILDSIVLGDTRVAGRGLLVCTTQDQPYNEGVEQIHYHQYESCVEKVEVERAGRVRAVVKIEGSYAPQSSTGNHQSSISSFLPFTVRLYFYAGSEQVRLVHTFIYNGDQERDFIRSLGVRFEVPMREQAYNRHVAFATHDGGVWSESVQPLSGRRVLGAGGAGGALVGGGAGGALVSGGFPAGAASFEQAQVAGHRIPEPSAFDEKGRDLLHHWARWNTYRLSQPNDQGYAIQKRAHTNNQWVGTHTGPRADGYAFAGDVSGGLGVSIKDFWQSYPASLQVDSATHDVAYLTAYLWSPDAGPMDLRHYDNVAHDLNASYEDVQEGMSTPYGIARTSTLTLIPERAFPGKAAIAQRARQQAEDAPLLCTPEYLHSRRAFGVWSLPDRSNERRAKVEDLLTDYLDFYMRAVEEHHWYGFWNYGDFMHGYDPERHMWKYDVGGFAWDNTELGSISWLWYSFLRTARPDIWRAAEAMTRHTSEVDVYHLGPYASLGSRHNVSHWGCGAKEARISQAAWNRFYYYLTTDERTGDLMTAVRDADQMLYTIDPMRLALPREKYPCTAPARLRIGPDWVAYAGNWMTEYERTRNVKYLKKIQAGMKSIAALPNGMFTGPGVLGYDPATGILSYEGDPAVTSTNHLKLIMGGFELMHEMLEMVPDKKFEACYLDHNARYHKVTSNRFRISRLKGYAAAKLGDKALATETWEDMWKYGRAQQHYRFDPHPVLPPEVPQPVTESAETTTNDCALWSLEAIYLQEVIPQE
ncbi:MAG: hypothetical protein IJT75_02900 [Bacteroidaceae bacterium]|nr:hypothetical protein [Bacteroidaceae bacterium]